MNLLRLTSLLLILVFIGCRNTEKPVQQYDSSLIHQEYSLDSDGNIISTEFHIEDFSSANECKDCHVSQYNEWASSFHAKSFNDPVFMSMWSSEKDHRPITGLNYCIQCHAPAAFLADYDLSNINSISDITNADIPDIIKEGVSCDICHTMVDKSPSVYTEDHVAAVAQYYLNPESNIKYGSTQDPDTNTYHESMFLPIFNSSSSCKPCHNQFIRGMPIEATFSEWDEHPALSMGGVSCQSCHMKRKADGHTSHYFAGVDVLFYDGVDESSEQYQEVSKMLQESAIVHIDSAYIDSDILHISISVENLTGHNLPSGTSFSREAWIELTVSTNQNDIIYSKGIISEPSEELDYNDLDLMLYTTILYDQENLDGNIIYEASNALSYEDRTLRTLFFDSKTYTIDVSNFSSSSFIVNARMLFRSFKPQMINQFHPESVLNIPIFEISNTSITIED